MRSRISQQLFYAKARVEVGGDFNSGEQVVCERIGNTVTITAEDNLTHNANSSPQSADGIIPSEFRPTQTQKNVYNTTTFNVYHVEIDSFGKLRTSIKNWTGSGDAQAISGRPTITYTITGNA